MTDLKDLRQFELQVKVQLCIYYKGYFAGELWALTLGERSLKKSVRPRAAKLHKSMCYLSRSHVLAYEKVEGIACECRRIHGIVQLVDSSAQSGDAVSQALVSRLQSGELEQSRLFNFAQ